MASVPLKVAREARFGCTSTSEWLKPHSNKQEQPSNRTGNDNTTPRSRLLDGRARAAYAESGFSYEARAAGGDFMAVKLELTAEIEASLTAQAHENGLTLQAYIAKVLRERSTRPHPSSNRPARKKRPPRRKSLAQLFAESPLKGLDLKFERDSDTGRPLQL